MYGLIAVGIAALALVGVLVLPDVVNKLGEKRRSQTLDRLLRADFVEKLESPHSVSRAN